MEFFIQFMMIGHLAILILKKFYINGIVWTIVFSLQMVLTEIIPFAYLVFGMFYRLKIYQKKEIVRMNFWFKKPMTLVMFLMNWKEESY